MRMAGAIFDLDGTLLDSMPVWEHFGELYLQTHGINTPVNLAETLKTMSLPQSARYFRETFGLAQTEDEVLAEFSALLSRQYQKQIPLKSHVLPFLQQLKQAGVRMCVATATDSALAQAALERLACSGYFEFLLTCAEASCGKDDPAIFLLAQARLGTPKEETVVFEDALHAILAAKEAGLPVVGVFDASASADRDRIVRVADKYINSFEQWGNGCDV